MIRRDVFRGKDVTGWLLVRQTEHARLSAQLARHWDFWPDASLAKLRNHLIEVVRHHDDGWSDWDQNPTSRAADEAGAPLNFFEMPLDAALAIWSESIRVAGQLGPLAGSVVAGHFLFLLKNSTSATDRRAKEWSEKMAIQRDAGLRQWQTECPELHTSRIAGEALQWLQIWDALSLWFCCSEPRSDHEVTLPDQRVITLHPIGEGRVEVSPWVFQLREVGLDVHAVQCPAERNSSVATLIADRGQSVKLRWFLTGR